jgi:hypothetical protein
VRSYGQARSGDVTAAGTPDFGSDDETVVGSEVPDIGDDESEMPDLDDEHECEAPDIGSYDEFKEFVWQSGSRPVGRFRGLSGLGLLIRGVASRVRREAPNER